MPSVGSAGFEYGMVWLTHFTLLRKSLDELQLSKLCFPKLVQGLEKSTSPESLLEMQTLRLLLRELNQNKFLTIPLDVVCPLKF